MQAEVKRAYLQLHVAIVLWGFTAILGKLITLNEIPLVWHRLWIAGLFYLILPAFWISWKQFKRKDFIRAFFIGWIVCLHWVFFYGSIKASNASVALSTLATASFFTALIEPLVFKRRVSKLELLLGVLVAVGISLIFYGNQWYAKGIVMGLISAVLAATFSTLNKKYTAGLPPYNVSFIELGSGWLLLSAFLPFYFMFWPEQAFWNTSDLPWLLILAVVCTSLTFVLALKALRHLSAFTANISLNLEPVYGIFMAGIFFKEHLELSPLFFAGTAMVLACVVIFPLVRRRQRRMVERVIADNINVT